MLVTCVVYENGRKLAEIDKSEIRNYLARPECFIWVALRDASEAELAEMQEQFGLHELAVEDARHGHQRPKIEEYGGSLFLVMHTIEFAGEEMRVGEVDIFVGENYVVSVRSRTERGFQDVRARCESEPDLLRFGSGYVLYALMAVAPRIGAVGRLHGGRVPQAWAGMGGYYRDVYDHLVRLNSGIDSIRDTVTTAISVALALITVGESEVTKRLAAYAALVAVPTLIAGIYGMNFAHMPELKWSFGYPVALAAMAGIDGYLWCRFRKAGWL